MSMTVQTLVRQSTIQDATLLHVLEYLANCGDDFGGNCFPGTALIARMVRRSERTVIRTVAQLEAQGWIGVVKRGDGKGNRTEFQINIDKLKECQDVTLIPRSKRVTLTPAKGDIRAAKGDIGVGRTVKETPGKQKPPQPPQAGASGAQLALVAVDSSKDQKAVERAIDQVCSALGIANRRRRKVVGYAVELAMEKGEPAPTVALSMIAAVRAQDEMHLRRQLKFKFGLQKFLGEGIWRDRNRWAWDPEQMRLQAEARVGSR
jgi:hypothetical protein